MKAKILAILMSLLIFLIPLANAQEDVDSTILDEIETAFTAMNQVNSLQIHSQTEVTESVDRIVSKQMMEIDLVKTESGWNGYSLSTHVMDVGFPIGQVSIANETIWFDGTTYIRFTDVPRMIPIDLPRTWINAEVFAAAQGAGISDVMTRVSPNALMGLFSLPINSDTVSDVIQLPDESIDDRLMHVYKVTINSGVVASSPANPALLNMGMAGGVRPGEASDASSTMVLQPDNVRITLSFYISQDTDLIHRMSSMVMPLQAEEAALMTITMQTDFLSFNEPIEIVEPVLGS